MTIRKKYAIVLCLDLNKDMKKLVIISVIIFVSVVCSFQAQAFVEFKNIEVYNIENGTAKIKWFTPDRQTKGTVYFGEDPNNLDRYTGYSLYNYYHETILSGLKKNKTYYFKITATDRSGNQEESFLQSFSTKNMKKEELVKPRFEEEKILQTINNAVAIYWKTNEETRAIVYYGDEDNSLKKAAKFKSFQREHELLIHRLKPGTKYYLKIVAEDRSGNKTNGKLFIFNTSDYSGASPDLSISNISPLSFDEELIFSRKIVIKFRTNLVAKSTIQYGTISGKYKKKEIVSKSLQRDHQIILRGLDPETTYYYRIIANGSFNKKKKVTLEMTFTTKTFQKRFTNGSLVKGSGYKVYFINGNEKFWIESADVFNGLGYSWSWIQETENSVLNKYKEGKSIKSSRSHPNGSLIKYSDSHTVYLIENRKKRPFSSAESFLKKGKIFTDKVKAIELPQLYAPLPFPSVS